MISLKQANIISRVVQLSYCTLFLIVPNSNKTKTVLVPIQTIRYLHLEGAASGKMNALES